MALVKGTNCGFVTEAPTVDPGGSPVAHDTQARSMKDTAPAGAVKVTEIGWWANNATEEANYDVGIYDHNVGDDNPENIVGVSRDNAKGTSLGWKVVSGLDISITASQIFWLAIQLDNTATATQIDYTAEAGEKLDQKSDETELADPWGVTDASGEYLLAIYAVYETGDIELAGEIAAQSGMSGALQVDRKLAGVIEAQSGLSGSLTIVGIVELAGTIAAHSGLSGALQVDRELAGVIAAHSGLSGSLTVEAQPVSGGTFASLTRDFWWLD